MSPESKKTAESIAALIAQHYQPEKVILFGSQAWGAPDAESDFDFLVIKKTAEPPSGRARTLRRLLPPLREAIDTLVYTPEEIEEKIRRDRNLFLEDVMRHGVTLYDRKSVRR